MKRRAFLVSTLGLMVSPSWAANTQPWSAQLLKGGFDGTFWWAGLSITLDKNWKTYWRVPGDGGIAPSLAVTGQNIAKYEVLYPLPHRYEDEAGSTIGYKDQVVFPIAVKPADITKPTQLDFKSFFGVCETVCIPAQFEGQLMFDASVSASPDQALISQWQATAPRLSVEGPITSAFVKTEAGKIELKLENVRGIRDIFIEGNPLHYFGKPKLMQDSAILTITGAKSEVELRGSKLRITVDADNGPLEQYMSVL
jgi:DsbC/DsbD-like thiol-disulfide interchange protein